MDNQPPHAALRAARFRKSTRSSGAQECVAVGYADSWVGLQDTKEHGDSRKRTTLAVPIQPFTEFLRAVKRDQFRA